MKPDLHLGDEFRHKPLTEAIEKRKESRSDLLARIDAFISEDPMLTPSE